MTTPSAAIPPISLDPIFNDPPETEIDGVKYKIREVKYIDARRLGVAIAGLFVGASEGKGPQDVLNEHLDECTQIMALSTGRQANWIEELPASHVVRLFMAVVEKHRGLLVEGFRAQRLLVDLVLLAKTGASEPPSSSSP